MPRWLLVVLALVGMGAAAWANPPNALMLVPLAVLWGLALRRRRRRRPELVQQIALGPQPALLKDGPLVVASVMVAVLVGGATEALVRSDYETLLMVARWIAAVSFAGCLAAFGAVGYRLGQPMPPGTRLALAGYASVASAFSVVGVTTVLMLRSVDTVAAATDQVLGFAVGAAGGVCLVACAALVARMSVPWLTGVAGGA